MADDEVAEAVKATAAGVQPEAGWLGSGLVVDSRISRLQALGLSQVLFSSHQDCRRS